MKRRVTGFLIGMLFFSTIIYALNITTENNQGTDNLESVIPSESQLVPQVSSENPESVIPSTTTSDSELLNNTQEQQNNTDNQLYPGNMLSIFFEDSKALSNNFRIDSRGFIELPEVGLINCNGMNLADLREIITKKLSLIYKDTSSLAISKKSNQMYISILGLVTKPGLYLISPGESFQVALQQAGGLSDGAQMNQIQYRHQGKISIINYKKYLDTGDASILPVLSALDEIFIPSSNLLGDIKTPGVLFPKSAQTAANPKNEIKVFGEVSRPGIYSYNQKLSALDYLLQAGGMTQQAATDQIKIIDNETVSIFDLKKYLDTAKNSDIPKVRQGAMIFVPQTISAISKGSMVVYVMGEVQKPGTYGLAHNTSILDAIASAGGPTPSANSNQVRLISSTGSVKYFNLQAFINGKNQNKPPNITSGDMVYISANPVLKEKSWLDLTPGHAIKIIGAVGHPGRYAWSNEMNLMDLISTVGGPTKDADMSHIRVIPNDNSPPWILI